MNGELRWGDELQDFVRGEFEWECGGHIGGGRQGEKRQRTQVEGGTGEGGDIAGG